MKNILNFPILILGILNKESVDAEFNLGCCYHTGKGVEKDNKKAFQYYGLAASQQNETALKTLTIHANKEDAHAQYNLGLLYADGEGVAKDLKKAFCLYESAALLGHPGALYNLGIMSWRG